MLFNATRDDDVYVRAGDELVRLPLAPRPALLFSAADPVPFTVRIPSIDDEPDRDDVQLDWYTEQKVIGVMDVPARIPGALYLVEPETMRQFPHREDFVAPSVWAYVLTSQPDEYGDEDENREDAELGLRRRVAVLAGITRVSDPVAAEDTFVLEWPDEDEGIDDER